MTWLGKYHANLLAKIYNGSLHGGSEKLDALWPLMLGGIIFAGIDIGVGLANPLRLILLTLLLGPGVAWGLYVLFHEVRSWPRRVRRHQNMPTDAPEK